MRVHVAFILDETIIHISTLTHTVVYLSEIHMMFRVMSGQSISYLGLKGRVVCGTVYADMHLKDFLGSIVRVWYRIPVPGFHLVLRTWPSLPRKHSNGLINHNYTSNMYLH